MGISVNDTVEPLCIPGCFLFMLDAYVAVACLLEVAWDSHHYAAAARHSFDMLKPVVAREANS